MVMLVYMCSLGCSTTHGHEWERPLHKRGFASSDGGGGMFHAKRPHGSNSRTVSSADRISGKSPWTNSQGVRQVEHGAGIQHYSRYEQETGTHWRRTHNKRATNDVNTSESAPKTIDTSDAQSQELVHLHELSKLDHIASVLENIEHIRARSMAGNCTGVQILDLKKSLSNNSLKRFDEQVQTAIRTANVLNNMFRSWDIQSSGSNSLYNDAFYYSLVRAMVEGDQNITGAAIAFDRSKYEDKQRLFSPYAFRNLTTNTLHIINIADLSKPRGQYTSEGARGYEWFWKHRLVNFSAQLWDYKDTCKTTNPRDSAEKIMNSSTVVTTRQEGLWSSPYFDCDGTKTWVMSYSVPFFGCATSKSSDLGFK